MTETSIRSRAALAATAMERLVGDMASVPEIDSITEAYLQRALSAAASLEDDPQVGKIEPHGAYLGRLRHDSQTSASRNP